MSKLPNVEIEDSNLVPTGEDLDTDVTNTPEQTQAVKRCSDWFTVDKDAKSFYVTEMDENDKLRTNKHWDLLGPTGLPLRSSAQQALHPNSIENVVHSLVEGQVAEFSQDIDITDFPQDEGDDAVALMMTDLKQYISYKNRIQVERLKWLRNFFWHGTGIWKHTWDPTWKGGKGPNRWIGEVRWQSRHPRLVFPDARCGEDIQQGRRIHDARYVTLEYVREKFPDYGGLAQGGVLDTTLLSSQDETSVDAQLGQVLLVETWYIGTPLLKDKKKAKNDETSLDGEGDDDSDRDDVGLHCIWWCGETNGVYLGHANYLYFDEGEDPRLPFTFRQRYPRDNSPWGYGEAFFIKQCQIMLNKTADIIMEGHVHQVLGQTLYGAGALTPKQEQSIQKTGTLAGMWHQVLDPNLIKRLYGSGVPSSIQTEMTRLRSAMENITGRYDVTLGRTPGSVTAFKALALLDQRAQVRLRSADVAVTTSYEDVGTYINQLIPKHYTERRAFRIIGEDNNGNHVVKKRGVFRLEEVQKVHLLETGETKPLITNDPETGQRMRLDLSDQVEGEDYELYVPELDVRCKTSATMPSERLFYMEMAKELLAAQAIDLEMFYSVVENGRFPPWNTIAAKMAEKAQAAQQAQPQGGAAPAITVPGGGKMTFTVGSKDPNVVMATLAQLTGQGGGQPQQGAPQGAQMSPEMQGLIDSLSPEDAAQLAQLPPEQLEAFAQMSPEEIAQIMAAQDAPAPNIGAQEWTSRGGMMPANTTPPMAPPTLGRE